jgi:pyruvate dehydrogenase E2 component (dihydrolipoamide acetyltransferase)
MATIHIMPRQGQSVESCVITEWNKKTGDKINEGDILFSYETDKSSFEEKSLVSGTILAILAEDGDDVPCLNPVCIIGNEGEDISAIMKDIVSAESNKSVDEKVEAIKDESVSAPVAASVATVFTNDGGKIKISPRARNLAAKTDADLSKASPTGPNGRIIERDVNTLLDKGLTVGASETAEVKTAESKEKAIPEKQPAAAYTDVKLTNIRKVIAKSMHTSLNNLAQLTLNSSFDATQIIEYRAALKNNFEKLGLENITLNDMVLYAVAKTIKNHKDLNAHYLDEIDVMRYFSTVNLGVAVDTERGLLVPTIFGADQLSLNELSKASKTVIKEAQSGTINPDKLKGATFTVTNLGSLGVESFTPVINPPQTAILGVDTLSRRIKEADGKDVFYTAMGLSLTFDHRALDGAPAAKFLKDLVSNLENFNLLLAR